MNLVSCLILGLVALGLAAALASIVKGHRRGGCGGCDGDCGNCPHTIKKSDQ